MRFKVELDSDARYFLKHVRREDRSAFYDALEKVRDNPIEQSESHHDPTKSGYMLRFFWFQEYAAYFSIDLFRQEMRIHECRQRSRIEKTSKKEPPKSP